MNKYIFYLFLGLIIFITGTQAGIYAQKQRHKLSCEQEKRIFKDQWDNCLLTLEKEMVKSDKCKMGVN